MTERLIIAKEQFKHEGDKNLFVVLAKWKGEYVVWTYNKEFDGYSDGHYYSENNLQGASEKYAERLEKYCR